MYAWVPSYTTNSRPSLSRSGSFLHPPLLASDAVLWIPMPQPAPMTDTGGVPFFFFVHPFD